MMSLAGNEIDARQWMDAFRHRVHRNRVPLTGHLELTAHCNLRCRHCYLGDVADRQRKQPGERDAAAVCRSLDEWAEAGCLHLVITGGEPMLRPDFSEVYRHAAGLGLRITVFSNGTRVNGEVLGAFRECPPRRVEISIYGATADTHDTVTRVPGSFRLARQGIRQLLDIPVPVVLKTVLLTLNEHELGAMADLAESLGCSFRFDSAVFPCLPGGTGDPVSWRVSPEDAVKWDLAFPERRRQWIESIERLREAPAGDRIYACGAGTTAFHADPSGNLSPCLMTSQYRYPQAGRPFREVWRDDLSRIGGRVRSRSGGTLAGPMRGACAHCPALNAIETGDEEVESDYMKRTAELRYTALTRGCTSDTMDKAPRLDIGPIRFLFSTATAQPVCYPDWPYRGFFTAGDAGSGSCRITLPVRLESGNIARPDRAPLFEAGVNWAIWRERGEWLLLSGYKNRRCARYSCRLADSFERAVLYVDGDPGDAPLRYPLDQILTWGLLARCGGLVLHAAAVERDGGAFVLAGQSGAGKSTLAKLCREAGWEALNDDRVVVYPGDAGWMVSGTPWHGSGHFAVNKSVPLRRILLLRQAGQDAIAPVTGSDARATMLSVSSIPWFEDDWSAGALAALEQLTGAIACRLFEFTRTPSAVRAMEREVTT